MKLGKDDSCPALSAKTVTLVLLLAILITSGLIFFLGHRSVFVELQITLLTISISLFIFLTVGLYKGTKIKNEPLITDKWKPIKPGDGSSNIDIGLPEFPDTGDDLAGFLISIILWILVSIAMLFILLFLVNILLVVILVLGSAIYWVFYRALRQVFLKSHICKGNIMLSIKYSLLYTVLYTGWIFGLIWVSRYLIAKF